MRRVLLFSQLLISSCLLADFHPADTDFNNRITVTELANYHHTLGGITSSDESLANEDFAQAWFIWKAGESYLDDSNLRSPHRFLPVPSAGDSYVSLTERLCLPLTPVEIHGLPSNPGSLTGRFRPVNTEEWLSLDVDTSGVRPSFFAPYVPTPWLPSRDVEIEISNDSQTWRAGILRLEEIDTTGVSLTAFLDDTAQGFANLGTWSPSSTVAALAAGQSVTQFERLMGYYYAYLTHTAESIRRLQQTPASPDTEVELLIAKEILALNLEQSDALDTFNPAPSSKSRHGLKASGSDCVEINDWSDLVLYTHHRAKLEAAENDESLSKKATDKALEKLEEGATKLGEKLASDSKLLAKRAGLAITIPLELHALLTDWDKKMLPKTFTRIDYTLQDGNYNPLPQPLPVDSQYPSGECTTAHFANMKATITSEGFSMAKYLLDNKVPEPDALKGLVEGNKGKVADAVVDYYSEDLGQVRQAAIDRTYDEVKDYDYAPGPCTWSNISIPQTRDDPKITLKSQSGRFAVDTDTADGMEPVAPGPDVIELSVNTTTITGGGTSNLPNTPPFKQLAPLVSGPPELYFRPPSYSVDDVEDPPKLTVDIKTSYENENLRWKLYDNTGTKIHEQVTTVNTPSTATESTHELEDYPVPDDHLKYPLLCIVESMAQGCLEGQASQPVQESATLYYQAKVFDLDPTRICREPGEQITITAIPHKPDPDFKVKEDGWEIIQGGGTITRLTDTTALLTLPDQPEAEITVKATGSDDFISQGYYTTGPCLKFVQTTRFYDLDPAQLTEGALHPTRVYSLNAGYGDFVPADLNLPFISGTTYDGPQIINGIGQVVTHFKEEVPNASASERTFEVENSGVILALLDFANPRPLIDIEAAQIGGSYFSDEELASDPRENVWVPHFGKGDGDQFPPVLTVTEDIYQIHFEYTLDKSDTIDETQLSPTWLSNRGTVITTSGPTVDPEDSERYFISATIEYPRTETRPDVNFTLAGTIHYPDPQDPDSDSLYTSATFVYQKVDVHSAGTITIPITEENVILCGPFGSAISQRSSPFALYNGCCGGISLLDYEPIRGAARRSWLGSAYIANDPDLGRALYVYSSYTDDPNILYCEEQRKKREEHPIPPEDLPEPPDPEPDPDPEEQPEELDPFFTDSPTNLDGPGDFPPPATPLPSTTTAGGIPNGGNRLYPYEETNFQDFGVPIKLGTFNSAGQLTGSTTLIDDATRNTIADTLTLVLYGRLSPTGASGIFVEREYAGNNYFDFWQRDTSTGKLIARTLIELTSSQHVVGLGDFNQDGHLDVAGRDASANLIIWSGSAAGISATPSILLPAQANWIPRSAAVNPDGTTALLSEDPNTIDYRFQNLNSSGQIVADNTAGRPDGQSVLSMADFNSDGWPDLVFHVYGLTDFTVHYTATGATTNGSKTYSFPPNGGSSFSFYNLPQSLRD
ncbi:MAG: VCBS repeat-containing protein [Verrucomicrobiota bacterium JB023]|nr:VCBS repeat-containing protein [Verrucomicrobiota bacterium JB023]